MIEEVATHPQPVYGEHVYQDATYPVSLDVFDGMQFSDWMKIKEFDVKIGMDLNAFRKLPHQQAHPLTMNVLARYAQPNKGEEALFKQTDDLIAQAVKDRKLQVTEQTRLMLDGKPAYFIKGTLATNRGMSDVAGALVYVNDQEAYMTAVAGFGGASDAAKMEKTVKSLRLR
jgi:glutamine synthetase